LFLTKNRDESLNHIMGQEPHGINPNNNESYAKAK
jgi:hypothetical protein